MVNVPQIEEPAAVSAFSAYNVSSSANNGEASTSSTTTKTNKSAATTKSTRKKSLSAMTTNELVAEILSKKKQQMKRKSTTAKKKNSKKIKLDTTANGKAKVSKSVNETVPSAKKLTKTTKKANKSAGDHDEKKPFSFKIKQKNPRKSIGQYLAKTGSKKQNGNLTSNFDSEISNQSTPIVDKNSSKKRAKKNAKQTAVPMDIVQSTPMRQIKREPITPRTTVASKPALDKNNSIESGKILFEWVIKPVLHDTFLSGYWEKAPIYVGRKCPSYYEDLLSTEIIDNMLRENRIEFTKNIDITSYENGERKTLNPEGRALPPTVWDFYREGCSIRLLNPQTFIPAIHSMNSTLQEYFQCMTGANVYLTPPNSQGFAPHYDDIEAFVLQIEGKKRWRVYNPRSSAETLPRVSSQNFDQSEIGEPCLDITLEAGDLLYFPRGFIHQASTVPDHHSLHITLSVYQKHSYADLLEILLPMALQQAISENEFLRNGLPIDIFQKMGLVYSDRESERRTKITQVISLMVNKVLKNLPIDEAVDQMALRYQHDALPPALTPSEQLRTVYKTKATLLPNGDIDQPIIEETTEIRLVRANILRLVQHTQDEFRVYYHSENSKEYHEFEVNYLEISVDDVPAVDILIHSYPNYIKPSDLGLNDIERCLAVAQDLWEKGLLITVDELK